MKNNYIIKKVKPNFTSSVFYYSTHSSTNIIIKDILDNEFYKYTKYYRCITFQTYGLYINKYN